MSGSRAKDLAGQRIGLVGALLALVLAGSGCSAGDEAGDQPGTDPTHASAAQVQPTGEASAFPVAPSASPSPLPVIGSATSKKWTFTLNAVRRTGPAQLVVEGTLTSAERQLMSGFAEHGFETYRKDGENLSNWDFSGVRLSVPGDDTVYLPMRDAEGRCACTQSYVSGVDAGDSVGVYVIMTTPENASAVTVRIQGFPPFRDVAVGR
jgi:hypothetical protein